MRIGFFGDVSNTIRLLSSVVLMELCLGADTGFTAAAMDSYQHFTRTRLSAWRICQPTESKSD